VNSDAVIRISGLATQLGGREIHRDLNLDVARGEVVALIGGSGTGKSVLLREIIGLLPVQTGRIELFGESVAAIGVAQMRALRRRFGVLFQDGALFSSLSVEDNVATPLFEHTDLPRASCRQIARLKLALAGLPPDAAGKMPSECRAACASAPHSRARSHSTPNCCFWTSRLRGSIRFRRARSTT
jgi:ABC-type transport system involved in resistance to organic solvents, ATPase component